jgi:predicted ATPase
MSSRKLKIAVSGFPGTGKTSLVKALGEKFDIPIIQENMLPIRNAEKDFATARMQRRTEDLPALHAALVESFVSWDAGRTKEYQARDSFVADRWEADLLDWWLVRFGQGRASVDSVTTSLLKNFQEKSKIFNFVVITPVQKPFSFEPNEQGNTRSANLTMHVLNMAVTAGLVQHFTDLPALFIPNEPMSVEERVDFVSAAFENAMRKN